MAKIRLYRNGKGHIYRVDFRGHALTDKGCAAVSLLADTLEMGLRAETPPWCTVWVSELRHSAEKSVIVGDATADYPSVSAIMNTVEKALTALSFSDRSMGISVRDATEEEKKNVVWPL